MSERTGKDDFIFTWIIEDFFTKSDLLISPEFNIGSLQNTVWCLKLYPKGLQSSGKCVDLYLCRKDDAGPQSITLNYEISIIAENGGSFLGVTTDYTAFVKNSALKLPEIWNRNDLLSKTNKYLLDNALTIQWRMWTCFAPEPAYNRCTAVTRSEAETVSFKKSIKNFSAFYSGHRVTIPIPLNYKYEMVLRMERSGFGECLVISVRKNDKSSHRLFCKLSLLNSDGVPLATKEDEHIFNTGQAEWSFPPFTEFEELKAVTTFLRNDTLWLYCEITVYTDNETSKITEKKYVPPNELSDDKMAKFESLSNALYTAYLERTFTDVELVVEDKSFSAHRFLLSARSPVFKTMFQTDKFKSKNGRVELANVDVNIVADFLNFLYTGSLNGLDFEKATKLFITADKYKVLELKNKCLTYIKKNLMPPDVWEIMNLAKTHEEEELKLAVEECFCSNSDEILASESWKRLVMNDICLATEMLQKLTTKQRRRS